ncbi:MAG: radical SAM protein [Chloroflexi bacterium]|nr:radical SAM protein [Chloroflexota bacterium]
METLAKLAATSQNMFLEPDAEHECQPQIGGVLAETRIPIAEVVKSGGGRMKVLKTMLTTACERDCHYCPFRAGRHTRRATFKPDELAGIFTQVHRAGAVEGLFLSSGIIKGGVTTQDKLLDTAEILRKKRGFRGYLHLKVMPGLEKDQLLRAMQLASRVSINLEAPNAGRLAALAPKKRFDAELLAPLVWAHQIRRTLDPRQTWNGRWASTVTQFVVGAVGETDLELVSVSERLYKQLGLARAYYSAFHPIADTPFEDLPAEDEARKVRLYQTSFLLRDYGFSMEELPFEPDGSLPRHTDPKTAWARQHLAAAPIELNRASREELLRVPGIGLKGADRILHARRQRRLHDLSQLSKLGIRAARAADFVLLDGRRPARQPALF